MYLHGYTPYQLSEGRGFLGLISCYGPMSGAQGLLIEFFVMMKILGKEAFVSQGFSHWEGKYSLQQCRFMGYRKCCSTAHPPLKMHGAIT